MPTLIQPPSADWVWTTAATTAAGFGSIVAGLIGWAFKSHAKANFAPALSDEEKKKELKALGETLFAPKLSPEEERDEVLRIGTPLFTSRAEYHKVIELIQALTIQSTTLSLQVSGLSKLAEQQHEASKETNRQLGEIAIEVAGIHATWTTAWELQHGAPPARQRRAHSSLDGKFGHPSNTPELLG
jgi:hypothetical protein